MDFRNQSRIVHEMGVLYGTIWNVPNCKSKCGGDFAGELWIRSKSMIND